MKTRLLFLCKYYLFWVMLSVVARAIFLCYQWHDSASLTGSDVGQIFWKGLQHDLSLGGYIMMAASLIMAFSPFFRPKVIRVALSLLTLPCLVFFSIVMTVDLELFKNWGYHIDTTPLMYLKTPQEAMASTPIGLILLLLFLMVLFTGVAWFCFKRFVLARLDYRGWQFGFIPIFLIIGGTMIIPVRGGFNVAPMNSSFVFFHPNNMYANQAAINPVWNFVYELMHMDEVTRSFSYMSTEESQETIQNAEQLTETHPQLLNNQRPNIVFLLLESFTANAIEPLGGLPEVTPCLNALVKEGILFSNIYATGSRSDRGMLAAISALPSNPSMALIEYPNRVAQYPCFPKDLEKEGYSTRYYYAGDINFGSFRSYVTMSFQEMVTEDDFSGEAIENRFKWGVHDEYMFDRLYEDLTIARQPFFYTAFNMSSHEPFDVPGENRFPGEDQEHKFMNAIHYSDHCIGDFIQKCKDSGLWDNTLFILMADHGTRIIKHVDPNLPEAYHIPLLLTGGVLNVRDTVVATIGSQTDMVATVLAQLGMDHSAYKYSRNLLAKPLKPFAFYSYSNAAAVISEDGVSILNLQSGQFIAGDTLQENKQLVKAYLQEITTELGNTSPIK